jgi:uncharacterized membrane protein
MSGWVLVLRWVPLIVLAILVAALGTAVRDVPLSPVRLVVGALLLVFGLQWLRKGVLRVARDGWGVGNRVADVDSTDLVEHGFDWPGFVLSFKGVSLEGLEVAVIVVAFGTAAGAISSAMVGAAAAIIVLGVIGGLSYRPVARIPRRALQLFVGAMLTTFGTFWAGAGLGVAWAGRRDGPARSRGSLRPSGAGAAELGSPRAARHHTPGGAGAVNFRAISRNRRASMSRIGRGVRAFVMFWGNFIIGDDWTVAATVALALLGTWGLTRAGVAAWWLLPLPVLAVTAVSIRRTVERELRHDQSG